MNRDDRRISTILALEVSGATPLWVHPAHRTQPQPRASSSSELAVVFRNQRG